MTELTRREFIQTSLVLAGAPALLAQDAGDGLVVHEWGVFTIAQDTTWGAARTASEVASNPPPFVHTWSGVVGQAIENWKNEPVIIFKPVIYFYSKIKRALALSVGVPFGRPAVWWPPATEIGPMPNLPSRQEQMVTAPPEPPKAEEIKPEKGFLKWTDLAIDPTGKNTKVVAEDHWWHTARETDSATVSVNGESDKFLFYDALTPVHNFLKIQWTEEAAEIRNADRIEIGPLVAVRVREGKTKTAWLDRIAAGDTASLTPTEPDPREFAKRLQRSGLFGKEADGMAKIWEGEFFRTDGFRVIYWMPAPRIESLLPLTIEPAPAKLVRILLVHVESLAPDQEKEISALIEKLGGSNLDERESATAALEKWGPRAEGALRKAMADPPDPETWARAKWLIEKMGARP